MSTLRKDLRLMSKIEQVYARKKLYLLAAPICKCDFRGKHYTWEGSQVSYWCWLQESPCKSLTGRIYDNSETRGDCDIDGVKNLECNTVSGIT